MYKKRRFCHLICKNAAEAKRKFTLFANYRINSLSFKIANNSMTLGLAIRLY